MARKPSDSAYLLALTLRRTMEIEAERVQRIKELNENTRVFNVKLVQNGLEPQPIYEENSSVYWHSVIKNLGGMEDASDGLSIILDSDYRAVIWDALKQPYSKVRKSIGFQKLVPILSTLRRYGPYDDRREMDVTEEEARDLADLIWQQEMQPFIDEGRGVDPINKQIIANKVSNELKSLNVKYLGEEIIHAEFDDAELDAYTAKYEDMLRILEKGIECAFDLFNYSPQQTDHENRLWVRQAVVMYDSMFQKDRSDEQIDNLVDSIICCFQYLVQLVE